MAHASPWLRKESRRSTQSKLSMMPPASSPALHQPLVADELDDAGEDDDADEHGGTVDAPEAASRLRDARRDDHILAQYRCMHTGTAERRSQRKQLPRHRQHA